MDEPVLGFSVPVHRALTEPILLGGAPRAVAILNGTLAAALGLGLRLWIAGCLDGGDRSGCRRLGSETRSSIRRRGAPASSHPRLSAEFEPMMNLAEYRRATTQLADFLPWAAMVDEGLVLNKDGSFQRTAKFRGPDLNTAVPAELVGVAGRLNNAFRRLGSGWAVFVEAQRHAAGRYPESRFPDVASALVDLERQEEFEEEGVRFEIELLSDLPLSPATPRRRPSRALSYEGRDRQEGAGCSRSLARLYRSHRPRTPARRGLHARDPVAR